jgi:hypothetical protein
MAENLRADGEGTMNENRYAPAGWLALAQAVLFPLAFIIGIVQTIVGAAAFRYHGPVIGPADAISILVTGISVYVLLMFRKLLNERYDFHGADLLIIIAIWWAVLFEIGALILKVIFILITLPDVAEAVTSLCYLSVAMVTIGIIDIMLAVQLLKIKDRMDDLFRAYVYITMASGILEVSVILSIFSLILFPISSVILGMVFLKQKEEVDFV